MRTDYDTIDIMTDEMLAVLPEKHPMTEKTEIPLKAFEDESVILLQEGGNQEIEEHFRKNKIAPHISYYSGDDYAVMSMVENELGNRDTVGTGDEKMRLSYRNKKSETGAAPGRL